MSSRTIYSGDKIRFYRNIDNVEWVYDVQVPFLGEGEISETDLSLIQKSNIWCIVVKRNPHASLIETIVRSESDSDLILEKGKPNTD